MNWTRRTWLGAAAVSPWGLMPSKKVSVAAVVTEYRRNSHADVIVGKILEGFKQDGGDGPQLELLSLCTDQVPRSDLSRGLSRRHGFRITDNIAEALTLGTDKLQVQGVLSIGEHGQYPLTPNTRQKMYPRRRFFDEIVNVFRRVGQVAPVFNDKHLAYRWQDAQHMFDTARKLPFPFMAGSSLPVTWRRPATVLPQDSPIKEALVVGYGGLESYGFHALESLQCIVERRDGGETGVRSVQAVTGDAVLEAEQQQRWSRRLLQAALKSIPDVAAGDLDQHLRRSTFYLVEYRDGMRAAVAMMSGLARHFAVACQLANRPEPYSVWLELEDQRPYSHFAYLLKAIEHMFLTGRPAYPVERTLLTTGVLDAAMHSVAQQGRRLQTDQLNVRYQASDWPFANQ